MWNYKKKSSFVFCFFCRLKNSINVMTVSKNIVQNLIVKGQTVSPENMDGSHWGLACLKTFAYRFIFVIFSSNTISTVLLCLWYNHPTLQLLAIVTDWWLWLSNSLDILTCCKLSLHVSRPSSKTNNRSWDLMLTLL